MSHWVTIQLDFISVDALKQAMEKADQATLLSETPDRLVYKYRRDYRKIYFSKKNGKWNMGSDDMYVKKTGKHNDATLSAEQLSKDYTRAVATEELVDLRGFECTEDHDSEGALSLAFESYQGGKRHGVNVEYKNGKARVDTWGFKGGACESVTHDLEQKLGATVEHERKAEFYDTEDVPIKLYDDLCG